MNTNSQPKLVLGGRGKTGRRVAKGLAARGVPVRIGSRSGTPPFEWNDPNTWAPVLEGVDAAYVSYSPDLAIPGAAETVGEFAELAVRRGVRRLVLVSGRGEPGAQRGEQAVRDSGADWTILRASWFNQNFSEDYLLEPVRSGVVALPAGDVPEPFVDADDIAEIAVTALTEEGHVGELYELTGPRLLTFADATAEVAAASGREIAYVQVTAQEYVTAMTELGVSSDVIALVHELFTEVLDGRNAHLTDGVQRALGREPRDFADYARATAATGVWSRASS
jgi:uncharacterized protein YbjT (DUF2867 family)